MCSSQKVELTIRSWEFKGYRQKETCFNLKFHYDLRFSDSHSASSSFWLHGQKGCLKILKSPNNCGKKWLRLQFKWHFSFKIYSIPSKDPKISYCLPYNSYVVNCLIVPLLKFFVILITCLFYNIFLILHWHCEDKFCHGHS